MFVHKMEGSWFDHPFWKSKFLIEEMDRLNTLKSSGLDTVIIDTSKGKAAPEMERSDEVPRAAASPSQTDRVSAIKSRKSIHQSAFRPTSTGQELNTAHAIAERAKESLHKTFVAARLGKALNVRKVEPVISDILASVRRNPQAFGGLMRCKLKNELMYRHALADSALMISLARRMKLSEKETYDAGLAGLLLDIGTNYLPQGLDLANDDFRNADAKVWNQHVMLGYRALQNDDDLPQVVLDACLQHHERMDGSGYPKGLGKDEIGKISRMAAICDTFDYLLTGTTASEALDPAAAVQRLRKMEGAFDEDILRTFIESVGLYPIGSFVRLGSDKLAMVIDEDWKDSAKPVVQAFYCYAAEERVVPHKIELARCEDRDEIIGIADLTGLGLPEDAQLRELIFFGAHKIAQ